MTLLDDYSGPFDPNRTLADFSREFLVRLGHEYLLIGHLIDRVGQPLVAMQHGAKGYLRSAIDEWMAASPIYSKRMQRLMNFEGSDVATVFKGLQLEIGSPQQFMDFQFRLDSPEYGEFWLAHCGALLDVEPVGGDYGVKLMCHDIEDPTFDATAAATHPRMVMRPIHRPPRIDGPEGNGVARHPHCRWSVAISDQVQDHEPHPHLEIVGRSKLAAIEVARPEHDGEPGGWQDYSGPFDPHCQLADFSHSALVALCQEFAVQAHLLVRSYLVSQTNHFGVAAARDFGQRTWVGHALIGVERLRPLLGDSGDGIEAIAKLFQLHPAFQPRTYVDWRVEVTTEHSLRLAIAPCPALEEDDAHSYFGQVEDQPPAAIEVLAQMVNPRARARALGDGGFAWEVFVDPDAVPAPEPDELKLAHMSRGMRFRFEKRRLLRA